MGTAGETAWKFHGILTRSEDGDVPVAVFGGNPTIAVDELDPDKVMWGIMVELRDCALVIDIGNLDDTASEAEGDVAAVMRKRRTSHCAIANVGIKELGLVIRPSQLPWVRVIIVKEFSGLGITRVERILA